MKNVLKAILILAIMFNCATFGNYSVYADCSHVFGEYVITQKSGCTTTGSKYRVCKKCGYKSTVMIYPRGHNTKSTLNHLTFSKTSISHTHIKEVIL